MKAVNSTAQPISDVAKDVNLHVVSGRSALASLWHHQMTTKYKIILDLDFLCITNASVLPFMRVVHPRGFPCMAPCDLKLGLNRGQPESNQIGSTPNKYKFCRRGVEEKGRLGEEKLWCFYYRGGFLLVIFGSFGKCLFIKILKKLL